MQHPTLPVAGDIDLTRRSFLKLGLAGSVVLGGVSLTATLTGCGAREQAVAQGFGFLRDADVVLFRALTPVVLGEALPADSARREALIAETLKRVDIAGLLVYAPAQAELYKLFDLLHLRVTRWLTTGVSAPWDKASAEDITCFLERWRDSSISAFNAGYRFLTKLVATSYFGIPETFPLSGYPGPLEWVYKAVNT